MLTDDLMVFKDGDILRGAESTSVPPFHAKECLQKGG